MNTFFSHSILNFIKHYFLLSLTLVTASFIQAQESSGKMSSLFDNIYELRSVDDRKLRAKILKFNSESVSIELESNKSIFEIPYLKFNDRTQKQLHQLWAMELNEKLGVKFIPEDGSLLSTHDLLEFTQKHASPRKIKRTDSAEYYYLADHTGSILGASAYSLRFYPIDTTQTSKTKSFTITFANVKIYPLGEVKTEIFSVSKSSDDLDRAIKKDKQQISKVLTRCFGEGTEDKNGIHPIIRWDSKGYSFILETQEREGLVLHITSTHLMPKLAK